MRDGCGISQRVFHDGKRRWRGGQTKSPLLRGNREKKLNVCMELIDGVAMRLRL